MDDVTIESLMELRGTEFIRAAYRVLVGREADENGLAHYKARLLRGFDKAEIIADLAKSKEGRAYRPSLPGLPRLVRHQRLLQFPMLGSLLSWLYRGCSKRMWRRLNSLTEMQAVVVQAHAQNDTGRNSSIQAQYVQTASVATPIMAGRDSSIEVQYLRNIMFGLVARQTARAAVGKDAAHESHGQKMPNLSPVRQYERILNSLAKDTSGNLMPVEAPEIFFKEQFGTLPPRSAAVLSLLN